MRRRLFLSGVVGSLVAAREVRAESKRRQTFSFSVEETEVFVPGLDPAHDGVRIGQLSDIHVGAHTPDGRIIGAVDTLNELRPDLVVLTGDYVTRKGDPLERVPELLGRLEGEVYAVLGNHDHWTDAKTIRRDLERCGFCVLQNQNSTTRIRGVPFTVLGVDDGVTRRHNVPDTIKGASRKGSRIVLTHAPPTIEKLPPNEGLLQLSGHTHGGQLYLAGLTDGVFSSVGQPYVRGRYDVGGNFLYVNRGLGFGRGSPLMRLGSEPEVALITLRSA
jgi:uncharacterized protein